MRVVAPLLVAALMTPAAAQQWITNPSNGHRYAFSTGPVSWTDAEAQAVQHGGHLVTIRSQAEQDWINQTFGTGIWIGFTDEVQEGTWVWSSGEPVTYTNWCGGEPNNASNEDYAVNQSCGWNDTDNSPRFPGLMEVACSPTQGSFTLFGTGCPGSQGTPLLWASTGQVPALGQSFTVNLSNLPMTVLNPAVGVLGFSRTQWESFSLPMQLSIFGMPGCTGFVSAEFGVTLVNQGGTATWVLAIPRNHGLAGLDFYVQGLVFDLGINPANMVVSNAGAGRIGCQ